jgi:hypothetical protein
MLSSKAIFEGAMEKVTEVKNKTWKRLNQASSVQDLTESTNMAELLKDLDDLTNNIRLCYTRYNEIEYKLTKRNTREVAIQITQGALSENYFSLNEALKLGLAPSDERIFTVRARIGEFQTKVLPKYKRLQDRSFIKKIFDDFNLTPGQSVYWREIEKDKIYEISPIVIDETDNDTVTYPL